MSLVAAEADILVVWLLCKNDRDDVVMKGGDDAAKAAVGGAALEKNTAAAGNNLLRVMGINDEAERSSREECRRNRDDDGNRSNILSLAMIGMQIGRRHYRSSSAMAMYGPWTWTKIQTSTWRKIGQTLAGSYIHVAVIWRETQLSIPRGEFSRHFVAVVYLSVLSMGSGEYLSPLLDV